MELQSKIDKIEAFKRELQDIKISIVSNIREIASHQKDKQIELAQPKNEREESPSIIVQQVDENQKDNKNLLNIVTPKFEEFTHGS